MREQSHKDEMARALRGDFARLRARGVATTLPPPLTAGETTSAAAGPHAEPSLHPIVEAPSAATGSDAHGLQEAPAFTSALTLEAAAPEIAPQDVAEEATEPVRGSAAEPGSPTSWLDRLRGR